MLTRSLFVIQSQRSRKMSKIDEKRERAEITSKSEQCRACRICYEDIPNLCDAYTLLKTHLEEMANAADEGEYIDFMGIDIVLKTADAILEKGKDGKKE